jgi:hypothetical protein
MVRKAWNGWSKFVRILGTVQMVIMLFIVYWVMVMPIGVISSIFQDPLRHKQPEKSNWIERSNPTSGADFFGRQG